MLPVVLERLYGAVQAQLSGEQGVAVKLGPLREDLDTPDAVGVAVDAVSEELEPAVGQTLAELGSTRESWAITCVAQALSGDDDLVAATARAWWLVRRLEAALPALLELDGVWEAEPVSHGFRPVRTDQGALAIVEVALRVQTIEQETNR